MSLRSRWPLLAVGGMMAAYVAYFGWLSLRIHSAFETHIFDLGYNDQVLWNMIRGRFFHSTVAPGQATSLAGHFLPTLLFLAPLYALWQKPEWLLLMQTAALALGALPVYWLGQGSLHKALRAVAHREGEQHSDEPISSPPWGVDLLAVALAGLYLLYFPLHSANVFEFHASTLATPLLLYALYFLRTGRTWPYLVCILLTMGTKEVMPLTTFGVGLYALFSRKSRVVGVVTMAVSALWFVLAVGVVIPQFNPEGRSRFFDRSHYGWLGGNLREVLTRLLTHPGLIVQRLLRHNNLLYVSELLRPLAYVPVLGLPVLLLAVPALLLNALSDWSFQQDAYGFYQYAAAITPFVIIATVDGVALLAGGVGIGLKRLWSARPRSEHTGLAVAATVVGLILVASLVVQSQRGYLPFSRLFYVPSRTDRVAAAEAIVHQVPAEGTVSADQLLGAHLAGREGLYLYPDEHDADFLVVDVRYREGPFPARDRQDSILSMLDGGEYGVVDGRHGYLLLERGSANADIPAAFYDFARAGQPSPQVELDVEFGGALRLLGYDLVWERPVDPSAHLVLYWEVLRPVEEDLRLFFIETDASGELRAGTELEFAETAWYPPSQWEVGEVVRTQPMRWGTEPDRRFGLAVGVVEGPGFWEVEDRLVPVVRAAPAPLPLLHGDSLLWLVTLETKDQVVKAQAPGTGE